MNDKKKICWVTDDCFLSTDFNVGIFSRVLEKFDIHWIITKGEKSFYADSDFVSFQKANPSLTYEFVRFNHRARDPHTILDYLKIKRIIRRISPDLIYFNIVPYNPYILPLYLWLPKEKTIVTAHDGRIAKSMKFSNIANIGFNYGFKSVKHVNMFSKYQASFFEQNYPGKDITIIPLCLEDFGKPKVKKRNDCISFLYFGIIHMEKNLELLIEAANQLYEEGIQNFKVSINGSWRVDWKVEDKVRHPDIFELNIGYIPNDKIPDIFTYNHYVVFPYKHMSQSGVIKCAYNYHTPVIVPNLPGFTDEVIEGIDGFIYKTNDIEDLKRIMRDCINRNLTDYEDLINKMQKHVEETYTIDVIANQYIDMFNTILER